jgi:signal transduction histidine kinase
MPDELGAVVYDNGGKELYPTPGGAEINTSVPLAEHKVHLVSDPMEPSRKLYAVVKRLPASQGGWEVMTYVRKDVRDAHVRQVWITSLGLLALMILLSLCCSMVISKRLVVAVDKLMRYLRHAGTAVAPEELITSPQELRLVQENMEATGRRLNEKTAALARLNQTLERQVQDRTEALSRSNHFLHSLFESLADGVVVMDSDGRCRTSNPRASELLGEERTFKGADLSFLLEGYDTANAEPQARMLSIGGRQLDAVRFSLSHAGYEENAIGCLLHDATEREALSHMKTTLISMAAHELRTPVQAIRLQIDALIKAKKEGTKVSPETQQELLTDLEESSLHLQTLIADWLDVARIDGGSFAIERVPISLRQVLTKAARFAKRQSPDQTIVIGVDEDAEGMIGDASRLQQLFLNLFTNSARYARAGVPSRVVVQAGATTGSDGRDLIRITAADNGVGVADEDAERIFDRFYQVQRGNRRRTGGTGLGLVIARAIAKAHGGRIWLQKGVQSGAVFVIELPVGIDAAEDEASPDAQEETHGR